MSAPGKVKGRETAICEAYRDGKTVLQIAMQTRLGRATVKNVLVKAGVYEPFRDKPSAAFLDTSAVYLSAEALAARIARDQAALHAPRIAALVRERERYGLPRVGRLVDRMAA